MVWIHYLFYYFLFRNIQTKIKKCILKFCCIYFSLTSCICCLMSCCLDGVSWPLARGSFAFLGYYFFYYFLLCTDLEHPDKNCVLKFWYISYWRYWTISSSLSYCDTLPVGLLPRWGLMASCPRIFCLMPISAVKKFIYIFLFCNFFLIWT